MAKNDDLHHLIVEQGKRQQGQAKIFNDLWAERTQVGNTKSFLEAERQVMISDLNRMKNELIHAQHALNVERYQYGAFKNVVTLKDELNTSLRDQLTTQRDNHRMTREQLSLVTHALFTLINAPGSDETISTLRHCYRTQMEEFDRLRHEFEDLTAKQTRPVHTQYPILPSTQTPPHSNLADGRPAQPGLFNPSLNYASMMTNPLSGESHPPSFIPKIESAGSNAQSQKRKDSKKGRSRC